MVASRLILVATDNHETNNTCFLFIAVTALWAICRSKNSTNATPLLSLVSLSLRMVTLTEKTNKQTNKCKKVCKQQQEGTENNDVHVSDLQMSNLHKALELDSTTGNRDLKIRRRRPQRERHKSNRFNSQNNNFACASRFFVHFFAVAARLRRENA